jgi:sterol desaturase/sphingolipid hydroxylase (fatty acid hydroxylase superfamily)
LQLSKFSYYSDFVAYPIAVVTLTAANIIRSGWLPAWLAAAVVGLLLWTFLEYAIHRIALHRMPVFSPMHALHHAAQLDFIATPSWVSLSVWLSVVLVPVWLWLGFNIANGLTVGIMLGYWWYGIVHHVIHHHAHKRSSAYFDQLRAWHMRHHHSPKGGNFGVTTHVWDYVFGTVIGTRGKAVISS